MGLVLLATAPGLGRGVASSQPPLLTLDEGYLLTAALPDLQRGIAPLGPLVPTGLEKVSFHSNPKERQCQRMLKLSHNCTHLTR